MKISVKKEWMSIFEGEEYVIDLGRKFGGYQKGDLICHIQPWLQMPLELEIAIRTDGNMIFRSWSFSDRGNNYLHTTEIPEKFTATPEQIDTVNGLWSGRIKFEGLKLAVGATMQKICPINVHKEEELEGKKIFLNG